MTDALIYLGVFFPTFIMLFWGLVSLLDGKGPEALGAVVPFGIISIIIAMIVALAVVWFLP